MSQYLKYLLLYFLWILVLESAQESAQAHPESDYIGQQGFTRIQCCAQHAMGPEFH
jgi:hypothetical protein